MKYLDLASFVPVNEWLASMECAGHVISGRLEAYSCKKTSSDRKLYKSVQMSGSFSTSEEAASMGSSGLGIVMQTSEPTLTAAGSLSPPQPAQPAPKDTMLAEPAAAASAQPATGLASPRAPLFGTGPLVGGTLASDENNTFVHLIATLNAALPDYDFSSAQSEHFTRRRRWRARSTATRRSRSRTCGRCSSRRSSCSSARRSRTCRRPTRTRSSRTARSGR